MVLGSLILGLLIDLESQAVESGTLNGKEAMKAQGTVRKDRSVEQSQ